MFSVVEGSKKKLLIWVMASALGAGSALAGNVGTTTADLLKINEGIRPAAMGGAYTAMGDDVYALSYNPAGTSYLNASQLILFHLDSLDSIQYEYLAFGTAWGSGNALTANFTYRHMPPIDNQNGNPAVNADDLLGGVSYARKIANGFRMGATVKFLKSDLGPYTTSTFACDLGLIVDRLPYGMRLGLSVQNLGPGVNFTPATSSDPLPMFIRAGIGTHQVFEGNRDLTVGVEVFKPSDQDFKIGLGGEFWLFPQLFAIRAGYKIENLGTPFGGQLANGQAAPGYPNAFQNFTLGCILTRKIEDDDFSLDVAYNPANVVPTTMDTFFFGLNFKFNQLRIF